MDEIDFVKSFEGQFNKTPDYNPITIDLNSKLQKTRHALQESLSENETLRNILLKIYAEIKVENSATQELLSQIKDPLFRNIPLPKNADNISLSEKAGYTVFYAKFLGYAARKASEEHNNIRNELESSQKSIKEQTVETTVTRTGLIKMPELEGVRELKRSAKTTAPPTPPSTPPKQETVSPTAGRKGTK